MTVSVANLTGDKMSAGTVLPMGSAGDGELRRIEVGRARRGETAAEFWIPGSLDAEKDAEPTAYKNAMRLLGGGVVVVTVGEGEERTGFTATSVVSLSAEPPRLMFGISQASSSWQALQKYKTFAVNVLCEEDVGLADRFAGRGGVKGAARYEGEQWASRKTGAPTLARAIAGFDCEVEEILLRHDHAIVIGRVKDTWQGQAGRPLLYWEGAYQSLR